MGVTVLGSNTGGGAKSKVVEELPEIGKKNTIYMVPNNSDIEDNSYDEYMWINDHYEVIGLRLSDVEQLIEDVVEKHHFVEEYPEEIIEKDVYFKYYTQDDEPVKNGAFIENLTATKTNLTLNAKTTITCDYVIYENGEEISRESIEQTYKGQELLNNSVININDISLNTLPYVTVNRPAVKQIQWYKGLYESTQEWIPQSMILSEEYDPQTHIITTYLNTTVLIGPGYKPHYKTEYIELIGIEDVACPGERLELTSAKVTNVIYNEGIKYVWGLLSCYQYTGDLIIPEGSCMFSDYGAYSLGSMYSLVVNGRLVHQRKLICKAKSFGGRYNPLSYSYFDLIYVDTKCIPYYGFANSHYVHTLILGPKVKYIGYYAFAYFNLPTITELIIPDSVEYIGYYAFYNIDQQEKLKRIVLGKGLKAIGSNTVSLWLEYELFTSRQLSYTSSTYAIYGKTSHKINEIIILGGTMSDFSINNINARKLILRDGDHPLVLLKYGIYLCTFDEIIDERSSKYALSNTKGYIVDDEGYLEFVDYNNFTDEWFPSKLKGIRPYLSSSLSSGKYVFTFTDETDLDFTLFGAFLTFFKEVKIAEGTTKFKEINRVIYNEANVAIYAYDDATSFIPEITGIRFHAGMIYYTNPNFNKNIDLATLAKFTVLECWRETSFNSTEEGVYDLSKLLEILAIDSPNATKIIGNKDLIAREGGYIMIYSTLKTIENIPAAIMPLYYITQNSSTSVTLDNVSLWANFDGVISCPTKNLTILTDETHTECPTLSFLGVEEVIFPKGLTFVGGVINSSTLTHVYVPNTVERIRTFRYCSKLSSVEFEEGSKIKVLPDGCFYNCSNLKTIMLPDGIEEIGKDAFNGTGVSTLRIPKSVTNFLITKGNNSSVGSFYGIASTGTLYCDLEWFEDLGIEAKALFTNWEIIQI